MAASNRLGQERTSTRRKAMQPPFDGGCECGSVRYRITGEAAIIYACHCTICQSQSGSAFGMAMRIPVEYFHLTKGTLKTFNRKGSEGNNFTNSFCPDCGTRIHHASARRPDQISLKPGTLDDTGSLVPSHHVWVRSRQPWVQIPQNAVIFETQPEDPSWLSGKQK
jgi:hypothetical protein